MALSVKKQKEVQMNFAVPSEASVMLVKSSNQNYSEMKQFLCKPKSDFKNKNRGDRYRNPCKVMNM